MVHPASWKPSQEGYMCRKSPFCLVMAWILPAAELLQALTGTSWMVTLEKTLSKEAGLPGQVHWFSKTAVGKQMVSLRKWGGQQRNKIERTGTNWPRWTFYLKKESLSWLRFLAFHPLHFNSGLLTLRLKPKGSQVGSCCSELWCECRGWCRSSARGLKVIGLPLNGVSNVACRRCLES